MNQVPQPTIVKKSDKKTKLILSLIFEIIFFIDHLFTYAFISFNNLI